MQSVTSGVYKIKTLEDLAEIVSVDRQQGRKVALCHGVFDLLHPGHISHLKEARGFGEKLVVTVTPDRYVNKGPGRPVFSERLRLETLSELECVDYVALSECPTAVEIIRKLKPDIYVKGKEYESASSDVTGNITREEDAVRSVGGVLRFTNGQVFSSSHLINRYFSPYSNEANRFLQDFRTRHGAENVVSALKSLSDLRVLVVGEAIIDEYSYCTPVGKSPKECIVSTKFVSEESFAGGVLATANHLAGFCRDVELLSLIGGDESCRRFIQSKLLPNVKWVPVVAPDRPTVIKRRFVHPAFMTKMFEVQYLDDKPISPLLEADVLRALDDRMDHFDLVVVNDFGHGFLTEAVRQRICDRAPYLALNTQTNSTNLGFNPVTKYTRADYVCLDDPELRLAAGVRHGDIRILARIVQRRLDAGLLTVSLGADGCMILNGQADAQAIPVMSTRIVDRTGAGDALFAVTSPCAFKKVPADMIGFIGNCVGALAVETVCNREPIQPERLYKFITALLK